MHVQAHKISERIHNINLLGLNGKTIGKVGWSHFALVSLLQMKVRNVIVSFVFLLAY